MTDIPHEAPDELVKRLKIMALDIEMLEKLAWGSDSALMREAAARIEELEAKLAQQDALVQAAVAAALREAALIARASFDGEIGYDEILDLITPDAQAALDRVVAVERERCAKVAEQRKGDGWHSPPPTHPYDKGYIAACDAILALIREGGE